MGVFHIALGGGEALERPDFFELVSYVTRMRHRPQSDHQRCSAEQGSSGKCRIFGQVNVSLDASDILKEGRRARGWGAGGGSIAGGGYQGRGEFCGDAPELRATGRSTWFCRGEGSCRRRIPAAETQRSRKAGVFRTTVDAGTEPGILSDDQASLEAVRCPGKDRLLVCPDVLLALVPTKR